MRDERANGWPVPPVRPRRPVPGITEAVAGRLGDTPNERSCFDNGNAMLVEFFKPDGRRYRSVLHRRDGLLIELDGGGYNKVGGPGRELPHDLAHFVVEDALRLEGGLWGVLAAGGMFDHAKVIAGRRPPHAAKRAQAVVDRAGDRLNQAEMLTRFVCDLALDGADRDVERLRAAAGERWWRETSADQLQTACRSLRETSVRWRDLGVGDALRVEWRLPAPK